MNKKTKTACLFCVLICIMFIINISSVAHSGGTVFSDYGSEDHGWIIRSLHHNANKNLNYNWDNSDPNISSYMTMVYSGAFKWNSVGGNITQSSSSGNLIKTYYDPGTTTVAYCGNYTYNTTTWHTSRFDICINRFHVPSTSFDNNTLLAHEFGHAFGLLDMQQPKNQNKLMYGFTSWTITGPTYYDEVGFNLITN